MIIKKKSAFEPYEDFLPFHCIELDQNNSEGKFEKETDEYQTYCAQTKMNIKQSKEQQEEVTKRIQEHLAYIPPWISDITKMYKCGSRDYFHSEIIDFKEWASLSEKDFDLRIAVFHEVESVILQRFPKCQVVMFGSTANRLALKGSDIDMMVHSKRKKANILFDKIF